jgi:hypothetical protein
LLLTFTEKGAPLRKVSVSGVPTGSTLAYDIGAANAGTFSSQATETGEAGSVFINEIPVPQAFPGVLRIDLQGSVGGTGIPIEAVVAQGFVTWMHVVVP